MNVQFAAKMTQPELKQAALLHAQLTFNETFDKTSVTPAYVAQDRKELRRDIQSFAAETVWNSPDVYKAYVQLREKPMPNVLEKQGVVDVAGVLVKYEERALCSFSNLAYKLCIDTRDLNGSDLLKENSNGHMLPGDVLETLGKPRWKAIYGALVRRFGEGAVKGTHLYEPRSAVAFVKDSRRFLAFVEQAKPGFHSAYFVFSEETFEEPERLHEILLTVSEGSTARLDRAFYNQDGRMVLRVTADTTSRVSFKPSVAETENPTLAHLLQSVVLKKPGEE